MLDTGQQNSCAQKICIQIRTPLYTIISNMERLSHVGLGLSQETEMPKDKCKLSKSLERVYLVSPFSFNLFRFEAETNLSASLLTSHTLSSISIQNTQLEILTIAKALLDPLQYWNLHLTSSWAKRNLEWNLHAYVESLRGVHIGLNSGTCGWA